MDLVVVSLVEEEEEEDLPIEVEIVGWIVDGPQASGLQEQPFE